MIIQNKFTIRLIGWLLGMRPAAFAFYPFIFIDPQFRVTDTLINHERIHLQQQKELLILPFYFWYLLEFLVKGYFNICFEREAYQNEHNLNYLQRRPIYNFLQYLYEKI